MRRFLLQVLLLVLLVVSLAQADITLNLVGKWAFDDASGTNANDSSPNNLDGTLINTPTWELAANCKVQGCLSFVAASSERVSLPNNALLNITGNLTLAAWIKTASTNVMIIGGYLNSASFQGYGFRINSSGILEYWNGAAWVAGNTTVNDNVWHHVAVTVSGTAVTFYKNASGAGTATSTAPSSWAGSRDIGSVAAGGTYFQGSIDQVHIFSRALSASDITELMNDGLPVARRRVISY